MNRDALREQIAGDIDEILHDFYRAVSVGEAQNAAEHRNRIMALLDALAGEPEVIRRARIEAYREAAELAQEYHDCNHFDDDHSEGMRAAGRSIASLLRQRADELERDAP